MNKLFILISLLSILTLSRGGCWSTIEQQAMTILEGLGAIVIAAEGAGVDGSSMDGLIKSITVVCNACSRNCAFIDTLGKDLTCAVDLYSEFQDATESVATDGIDIFADWDFLAGLYSTFEACDAAVKATIQYVETKEKEDEETDSDSTYNEGNGDFTGSASADSNTVSADNSNYHPSEVLVGDTWYNIYYNNVIPSGDTPYIVIDNDSSEAPPYTDFEGMSLQLGDSPATKEWIFNGAVEYMDEISEPAQYPVSSIVCMSSDGQGNTAVNLDCSLDLLATGEWQCGYFSQCATQEDIEAYWLGTSSSYRCGGAPSLIYADGHPNSGPGTVGGCRDAKTQTTSVVVTN